MWKQNIHNGKQHISFMYNSLHFHKHTQPWKLTPTSRNSILAISYHRFCPPEDIWQCLQVFLVISTRRESYWHLVGEGKDVVKHPTTHRTTSTIKNYPAPNANGMFLKNHGSQPRNLSCTLSPERTVTTKMHYCSDLAEKQLNAMKRWDPALVITDEKTKCLERLERLQRREKNTEQTFAAGLQLIDHHTLCT